ncbi:hypothetical protein COLO4_20136 [Corchorus olitorius]|uniref:Uncharacterized protein n=1 Tax=Corchorus olitorius TaxID=93759 RepID=A0A1R3J1F3_9ROSI|nr:hypothetical protein COLO4_20136 [Corchorus olitorius]
MNITAQVTNKKIQHSSETYGTRASNIEAVFSLTSLDGNGGCWQLRCGGVAAHKI